MNSIAGLMTSITLSPSAAAGIVAAMCGASFAMMGRQGAQRERLRRLDVARQLLDRRNRSLRVLDDDDTPAEVLDFAIRFSEFLDDPDLPRKMADALAANPEAFNDKPPDGMPREALAPILAQTRDDIKEALVVSCVAGILAFVERWPECRGAFEMALVDFAASPIREARHFMSVAERARTQPRGREIVAAR